MSRQEVFKFLSRLGKDWIHPGCFSLSHCHSPGEETVFVLVCLSKFNFKAVELFLTNCASVFWFLWSLTVLGLIGLCLQLSSPNPHTPHLRPPPTPEEEEEEEEKSLHVCVLPRPDCSDKWCVSWPRHRHKLSVFTTHLPYQLPHTSHTSLNAALRAPLLLLEVDPSLPPCHAWVGLDWR